MASPKQWMLGLPGHNEVVRLEDVVLLVRGGQLRPTDLVKKLGEPWRAANEVPELMEYFAPHQKPIEAPKATDPVRTSEPPRSTTRSIPRAESPKATRLPQAEAPPPKPARYSRAAERKAPTLPTAPAASEETPTPAAALPAAPTAVTDAPKAEVKPPGEPPKKERTRALPKAPSRPVTRLEPMVGKYFSPVDLLRSASFAFDPKKLLLAAVMVTPLLTFWELAMSFSAESGLRLSRAISVLATATLAFGFAIIWTALAYVARRQIEGKEYAVSDLVGYTVSNLTTAILYPILVMIPSLLSLGILWLLGFLRNWGPGAASFLKVAYIFPMFFAFLAVLGTLFYQLGSMYIPAAAAIEGQGLTGAVSAAWTFVRRQWGRVVLHWLIVTVAFGVITAVCLGLAYLAIDLPNRVFGEPDTVGVMRAWGGFRGVFAIYEGLAYGLGLTLPVSLFSTLGTLSYMSLRHPASAQLSPSPLDETSGIAIQGARGAPSPLDATEPGETRPAPPDVTPPLPGATPPPSEISDDSDEQPLVKD